MSRSTSSTIVQDPPSERMVEAVRLRDAGKTNAEIGAALGITAGTAGNAVVEGLRRMGRGDEVKAGPSGTGGRAGRAPVTHDPTELLRVELERVNDRLAVEREVMETTPESALDFDAWVTSERERIDQEIARLTEQRERFPDDVAFDDKATEGVSVDYKSYAASYTERAKATRERTSKLISELEANAAKLQAGIDALSAL